MKNTLIELAEFAKKIGNILERHGIVYHLTGGFVSSYYGELRNTQDIDIVVNLESCRNINSLYDDLKKNFLVDKKTFNEAIRLKSMFQLLDIETMLRADIYTSSISPDSFNRIIFTDIVSDIHLPIASPEDSILSKLIWIKLGSERSRKDIVGVLRVQKNLDNEYLETNAEKLGVAEILKELRIIAESYDPNIIM